MIPVICRTRQLKWWLAEIWLLLPFSIAVWLIAQRATMVAVYPHCAVTVVAMDRTARGIHWNQVMVHPKAITLGVAIGKQAPLQHLVWREANAGNNIRRIKCTLLNFRKIVFRVSVQLHHTHFN